MPLFANCIFLWVTQRKNPVTRLAFLSEEQHQMVVMQKNRDAQRAERCSRWPRVPNQTAYSHQFTLVIALGEGQKGRL